MKQIFLSACEVLNIKLFPHHLWNAVELDHEEWLVWIWSTQNW